MAAAKRTSPKKGGYFANVSDSDDNEEETDDADVSEYDHDEKPSKGRVRLTGKKDSKRGQLKILKRTKRERRKKIPTNQKLLLIKMKKTKK